MEKHSVSRLSYLFAHLHLFSSYSFSSTLLSSNLPLLSASSLLCFSSVHIVGSLTTTSYYFLLLPTTSYYFLLPPTTSYYLLLPPTTSYFLLLPPTSYYFLLLPTTSYYFLLLPTTPYHFLLLPTTSYYFLLLTTTYYYFSQTSEELSSTSRGPAGNRTTTSSLSATQECRDTN